MGFTNDLKGGGSLSREPWLSLIGTSSSGLDHISSLIYFWHAEDGNKNDFLKIKLKKKKDFLNVPVWTKHYFKVKKSP